MAIPKILKNSVIYSFVSVLQKALGFFLLPLYTYYLTPADYGILNVITSVSSLLSILFLLSFNGSASRFHYQNIKSEKRIKLIWGTTFIFVLLNTVVLGSILFFGHKYLLDPFLNDIPFYPFVFLGIITTVLNPLYLLFQSYLQTKQDGKNFGINAILYSVVNISLTIILLVFFKLGLIGILYANMFTSAFFLIYAIFYFTPRIKFIFSKTVFKHSINYSLPLIPHSLSGWLMAMIDRLFINNIQGSAQVGIYSIGFQFGNILNILTGAVTQAYAPWFFGKLQEGEKGIKDIIIFTEFMTVLYCIVAFGISLFSKEVLQFIVSDEFRDGWKIVPLICFAYVFNGIYSFFIATLFIKNTKFIPIVTFSAAILSIILNLLLIPRIGSFGAAISSLLSFFFSSIIALYFSFKFRQDIQHKWIRIYFITIVFFLISLTTFITFDISFYKLLVLKMAIYIVIIFALFLIYRQTFNTIKSTFGFNF